MSRPVRIEFPNALYHITSRGNAREAIYLDDQDREQWLEIFGEVAQRFNWVCYAYCLMGNHYHVLVETPEANLAMGMRHLNGVYTQRFNKRHKRVGHVYQGRYKAILVDKDNYLMELARYIVLNPVRAEMVRDAEKWPWSSYRAMVGSDNPQSWLAVDWLLSQFAKRLKTARARYETFVKEGKGQPSPWGQLKNQVFLGDNAFVSRMQALIEPDRDLSEVPLGQKRTVAKPLSFFEKTLPTRNEAIIQAYASGGYKMSEIADYFGLHYSSISKIIRDGGNS